MTLLNSLLKKYDMAVVSWPGLEVIEPRPAWFEQSSLDLSDFPFLESLLDGTQPEDHDELGPWEQDSGVFSAEFLNSDDGWFLLLKRLGDEYHEMVEVLQKARENSLAHEALTKEISKKNYLLHCIVHDLVGPLTSIKGSLQIIASGISPESSGELVNIGLRQCGRQEGMIKEILEVFSAEVNSLEKQSITEAIDLPEVADAVVASLRAAFQQKGLNLTRGGVDKLRVIGDRAKAERVISNLVENALRNTAADSEVEVRVTHQDGMALTEVLDRGPGVPDDVVPTLFRALSKGKSGGGKVGLGLYFCRLTVESWGGRIGYKPREGGGSNFWFELPENGESDGA